MKKSIMFVDDSVNVLESLKWIFMDESYHFFTFDDPDDALNVIGAVEFAVVVAEHSMQKMDGIEFLKRVQEKSPHTIGLIMAGHVDFKAALDCLYPGCVFQYIKKPLDVHGTKQAARMAISHYETNVAIRREEMSALSNRTALSFQQRITVMTNKEGFVERRKHKRFEVKSGVTAAAIEPDTGNGYSYRGKILNISQGGLAFQYVFVNGESNEPLELDIFVFNDIFCFKYLSKIPFSTVWISNMASEPSTGDLKSKQSGVQFGDLTPSQISTLDIFLNKYAI